MQVSFIRSFLFALLLCGSFGANAQPVADTVYSGDYHAAGAPLPPVKVVASDGSHYTNKTFTGYGNVLLMMFNPTCDHCEEMAKLFAANAALFKESYVLMVAGPMMAEHLPEFIRRTRLYTNKRILIGVDSSNIIENAYDYKTLPQINVYNHGQKLLKTFYGTVALEALKAYID